MKNFVTGFFGLLFIIGMCVDWDITQFSYFPYWVLFEMLCGAVVLWGVKSDDY